MDVVDLSKIFEYHENLLLTLYTLFSHVFPYEKFCKLMLNSLKEAFEWKKNDLERILEEKKKKLMENPNDDYLKREYEWYKRQISKEIKELEKWKEKYEKSLKNLKYKFVLGGSLEILVRALNKGIKKEEIKEWLKYRRKFVKEDDEMFVMITLGDSSKTNLYSERKRKKDIKYSFGDIDIIIFTDLVEIFKHEIFSWVLTKKILEKISCESPSIEIRVRKYDEENFKEVKIYLDEKYCTVYLEKISPEELIKRKMRLLERLRDPNFGKYLIDLIFLRYVVYKSNTPREEIYRKIEEYENKFGKEYGKIIREYLGKVQQF